MPKSYSNDLRRKVIEYISLGKNYDEVSTVFKISKSAIGRWYRRYKKKGIYTSKKQGGSKRKIDLKALQNYVESNENITLKEIAKKLGTSIYTVSFWLKKLGFTYKKKTLPTWKQTKKNEKNTKK